MLEESSVSKEVSPPEGADRLDRGDDSAVFAANLFGRSHKEALERSTRRIERNSIFLLLTLGVIAGLVNGLVLFASAQINLVQAELIQSSGQDFGLGFLFFALSLTLMVGAAALVCQRLSPAAIGSGLPEFKAFLAKGEVRFGDYEKFASLRVLLAKTAGLVLVAGGGLSVGSEGPLVHLAVCVASFLMHNVYDFELIRRSPVIVKQIFAASAAVGISSAFNAPVGGLLFSIEVTTTFYLISNYWKSCVAAVGGAAATYFLLNQQDPMMLLQMETDGDGFVKWELVVFCLIGVVGGYGSLLFLFLHQKVHHWLRPWNARHPLLLAAAVGAVTAVLVAASGSYTGNSVGVLALVDDVFNDGAAAAMERYNLPRALGTFINLVVRLVLTLLGTNVSVPAGIFMPVFLLGGLYGRLVGEGGLNMYGGAVIANYAVVGAVSLAAGVTHSVSVAVIALEMTGNVRMLLPMLVAAVVSAGISKLSGLSIYDQGMINKGIEGFQLLLRDVGGIKFAQEIIMNPTVALNNDFSALELLQAMEQTPQAVFPVVSSGILLGSLQRRRIYRYLKVIFESKEHSEVLRSILPVDALEDDDAMVWAAVKSARTERRRKLKALAKYIFGITLDSPPLRQDFIAAQSAHITESPSTSAVVTLGSSTGTTEGMRWESLSVKVNHENRSDFGESSMWKKLERRMDLTRRSLRCQHLSCDDLQSVEDSSLHQTLQCRIRLQEIPILRMNNFPYS